MKESLISFALFLICGFLSVNVKSQADSCSSSLNLGSQLPFDPATFNCRPVWSAKSFILRYSQTAQNEWSFVLSAPNTNSYIAMGFSPTGNMVGSSAIVGWVGNGGSTMKRYYLGGRTTNLVSPDQGNLVVNSSYIISDSNSSTIHMAFQLNTAEPETQLIYAVGPTGRLPSSPDFRLTEHTERVSTTLNYATGQSRTQRQRPYASLRRSHGLLNMIGWGIFIPIGAMVARYLRQWDPIWFYSHTIFQSLGFVIGVSGIICGFVLNNRLQNNVNRHKGIGIFILVLGCIQVIAFLARPKKESKVRKYWNWYHHSVGRILIFLAAVNIFYGIHLGNAGSGWNAGYAVVVVIFFIVTLILELRMWMTRK